MGVLDKLRGAFGIDEDEYEDDELEQEDEEVTPVADNTFKADFTQNTIPRRPVRAPKRERNTSFSTAPQLQVVLVKPEGFDEAIEIADSINAKRSVVLNLESATKEVARRLVDFLSGVAYANGATVQKVANSTFLISPHNVDVSGIGVVDDIDSEGELY